MHVDETGPNARASLSPASRVQFYCNWFWFSSNLIFKALYLYIFQSLSENGLKTYVCHDLPENNVTSKLSEQLKCTSVQLNTDIIVFQGSMANHVMEMECKVWWCYCDFCFIFIFFLRGVDGVVYITKYLFLLHCLMSISVVIYNVLKSHCFNSWDSYRR